MTLTWRWRLTRLVAVFAAALLLAACGAAGSNTAALAELDAAPAVSLLSGQFETVDGDSFDLGSVEGQDVVLWFWAPW